MPTGLGLRPGAKAPDEPPNPTGYAPPLDSTHPGDKRRREMGSSRVRELAERRSVVTRLAKLMPGVPLHLLN